MKLRDHPRFSFKGLSSWPPAWIWRSGKKYRCAEGEIGILKDVMLSGIEPCQTCFLIMHHERQEYVGVLLIEDVLICRQIYTVLLEHLGKPIHQIGDIDLSD
jgi:hypothetical protein